MSQIAALISPARYQPSQLPAAVSQKERAQPSASTSANSREQELTNKLDLLLSGRLQQIRKQIAPPESSSSASTLPVGSLLDIRA